MNNMKIARNKKILEEEGKQQKKKKVKREAYKGRKMGKAMAKFSSGIQESQGSMVFGD